MMNDNFNEKIKVIPQEKINNSGFSLDEIIIIASLIEREAKYEVDRQIIASVILNRLKIGMKLDIDATVQYVLGYQPKEKDWWKRELTFDDLEITSRYNTYKFAGLPPGPICNPGISVIKAVLDAPNTNYLYYLSDKSGKTYYAESKEEHDKNISKYLNK
jgi:UPF0755 protein